MPGKKFIDLFCGLGGFHLAASHFGFECAFACDINPTLRKLYFRNFNIEPKGDIREIDIKNDIPPHDLLCAGFPCQPFSKAGNQLGLMDEDRGTVLYDMFNIIEYHRPKHILIENVPHFVRHDQGNTYQVLETKLKQLGYNITNKILSPHQYGIPQIRQRMYLVGILHGEGNFNWPTEDIGPLTLDHFLEKQPENAHYLTPQMIDCLDIWQEFLDRIPKSEKLPSFPIWSMEFGATYPYNVPSLQATPLKILQSSLGNFGIQLAGMPRDMIMNNVPRYARSSSNPFPRWKQLFIEQNRAFFNRNKSRLKPWLNKIEKFPPSLQKFEWNCQGEERYIWKYIIQFRASGVRIKRQNSVPSLVSMTTTQIPIVAWEKRFLTTAECANLQCLDGLACLPEGKSAIKAIGNAVNVRVVKKILQCLL